MMALRESEIGIVSGEQKPSKNIKLPEQRMSVFYRNGTGATVKEVVTPLSFYESGVYSVITEGMEKFKGELKSILRRKKRLSRKTKHGGRPFSQTELTQRREALRELAKEESEVREAITPKKNMITALKNHLEASNPLSPLQLEVCTIINTIDIIKGTPMEEGDQKWWEFIRETPEIWDLYQTGREEDYEILHALFLARFNLGEAKLGPLEKENEAQVELDRVVDELELISNKRYARINPIIDKITEYFPD